MSQAKGLANHIKNPPKPTPKPPGKGLAGHVQKTKLTPDVKKFKEAPRCSYICGGCGSVFHGSVAVVKKNKQKGCPNCKKSFTFRLEELIKTKTFLFNIQRHLSTPDISAPLRFLVETQNRRSDAVTLAQDIERLTAAQLDYAAEQVLLTPSKDSKYVAMLDLVSKALLAAASLYEKGNTNAALAIRDELVGVLYGYKSEESN